MPPTRSTLALVLGALMAASHAQAQASPPVSRQPSVRGIARGQPPGDVAAAFTGPRAVRLGWTAPAGASGFVVLRAATAAGPWTPLTSTPIAGTTYEDRTAVPKARYAYRVAARYPDRLDAASGAVDVVMPCATYCARPDDCAPKPGTKLQIVEGAVGTVAQRRLTIKVLAIDAASGAALGGTVTIGNVTGAVGSIITYQACRQGGRTNDALAEIVPCRGRVVIPGRGVLRLVTGG